MGSGTYSKDRDGSVDTQGGPERVGGLTQRTRTGRGTLWAV